jgi:hypothetical protein
LVRKKDVRLIRELGINELTILIIVSNVEFSGRIVDSPRID